MKLSTKIGLSIGFVLMGISIAAKIIILILGGA